MMKERKTTANKLDCELRPVRQSNPQLIAHYHLFGINQRLSTFIV